MNIIGVVCVGPNEYKRYLKEVLEDKLELCDKIVVLGDGLKERKTFELCKQLKNVEYYETEKSLFNTEQWKLKQTALWVASGYHPDWVLAFDADELIDYRINRQVLENMASQDVNSYGFNFVHLWGDREHIRVDRGWKSLNKVIFYKYQSGREQKFPKRALHCGLVPEYAHKKGIQFSGYLVKHLGYMKPEDRPSKVIRYQTYDKLGFYKPQFWYDSIMKEGTIIPFNEKEFIKTVPTD